MTNCLIYAVSLVTGLEYKTCQSLIGHDGEEIIEGNKRGFHIQEVIERILIPWKFALTPLEFIPVQRWTEAGDDCIVLKNVYFLDTEENANSWAKASLELLERRDKILATPGMGILEGVKRNGIGHAYAKIGSKMYDQHGQYTIGELIAKGFQFKCFWKLDRI